MNNPTVSIIIPIYNVEQYLQQCLDSILNQTYTNLEIILVDDGSPDSSPSICDDYAAKDSRVKVIHQKNQGLSAARNAGLDICTGDFLTFVDSDDWIDESFIKTLLEIAQENEADIIICNHKKISSTFECADDIKETLYSSSDAETHLIKNYSVPFAISCCKLYHRNIFSKLRFPVGKINEDEYTSYKAFHYSHKVATTNKALYYYRQREDSITGQNKNCDYSAIKEEQIAFFFENNRIDLATYLSVDQCRIYLWQYWMARKKNNPESMFFFTKCKKIEKEMSRTHQGYFFQRMFIKLCVHCPQLYFLYKAICTRSAK